MVKKKKTKTKAEGFTCFMCGLEFNGKPHKTILDNNIEETDCDPRIKNICNNGCWNIYLESTSEEMENYIEDEVEDLEECHKFEQFLMSRADYKNLLDTICTRVEMYRSEHTGVC
jgi:hypothetical protein